MLPLAIIAVTLALVFYTAGVWSERCQRVLKNWHLGLFALGLTFDTLGTFMMSRIPTEVPRAAMTEVMVVTGLIALILMAVHLVWAVWTYFKGSDAQKAQFHKFSLVVWAFWLIPYFAGAAGAMM